MIYPYVGQTNSISEGELPWYFDLYNTIRAKIYLYMFYLMRRLGFYDN